MQKFKLELEKWECNEISDGEFLDILVECLKVKNYVKAVEIICDPEKCLATDKELIEVILETMCELN